MVTPAPQSLTNRGRTARFPGIWQFGYPYLIQGYPADGEIWPSFVDWSPAQPGVFWNWPRLYVEAQWDMFYRLGYSPDLLFDDGKIETGLSMGGVVIVKNYFRVYSDFYVNALMAEPPQLRGDNDELTAWLEMESPSIMATMREAVRWWTIKDRMVVLVDGMGNHSAIDPTEYWPICAPWNKRNVIGHLLAYTYRQPEGVEDYRSQMPSNRIRFVLFDPDGNVDGVARRQMIEYSLSGNIVEGERMGTPPMEIGAMTASSDTDIAAVLAEGWGESLYSDMGDIVRALIVRETADNVILNANISPMLWIPTGAYDPAYQHEQVLNPRTTRILQGTVDNQIAPMYVTYDATLDASAHVSDRLFEALQLLTGIPKSAYGMDVGKGESGQSREALLFTAHSKILEARRMFERIVQGIVDASPCPGGEVMVEWIEDPFISKMGRRQQALLEYEAGLVDRVSTLVRMGLTVSEAEQVDESRQGEEERAREAGESELNANARNPGNDMGGTDNDTAASDR